MAFANIAISGRIAVGTSTIAIALGAKLQCPVRDAGQIFRDISSQLGFDLEKNAQQYGEDVDRQVDKETKRLLVDSSLIVVNSKLAGFLSRASVHTLKILVTCPLETRLERYSKSRGCAVHEAKEFIAQREQKDQKKWTRLYGPNNFFDPSFFHLVLDSGKLSVEEEMNNVMAALAATRKS